MPFLDSRTCIHKQALLMQCCDVHFSPEIVNWRGAKACPLEDHRRTVIQSRAGLMEYYILKASFILLLNVFFSVLLFGTV
jgi:hypothetical protein